MCWLANSGRSSGEIQERSASISAIKSMKSRSLIPDLNNLRTRSMHFPDVPILEHPRFRRIEQTHPQEPLKFLCPFCHFSVESRLNLAQDLCSSHLDEALSLNQRNLWKTIPLM